MYVFARRDIYMKVERAVILVKKVIMTNFGKFGYLNSSCIKKVSFQRFCVPREINCRFCSKLRDRCFCCFLAAMLVPIRVGTSMASPYKSL